MMYIVNGSGAMEQEKEVCNQAQRRVVTSNRCGVIAFKPRKAPVAFEANGLNLGCVALSIMCIVLSVMIFLGVLLPVL